MLNKLKPKSEFSKNVLTLMTGTTIAQAIPIAISPILTRLYTPEDFGVFALYMSIVSILSVIVTGQYELAIMLPKNEKDSFNILFLSIILTVIISFIVFLIVFIFNQQITKVLNNKEISNWLYLVPFSILIIGLFNSFNYWFNRNKNYKILAKIKVTQSFTNSGSNLGFGLLQLNSFGLIVSSFISQLVAVILFIKRFDFNNLKYFNKKRLLVLAKKYKKFPNFTLFHNLLNNLSKNIPIILLAKYFSSKESGFFMFTNRIIGTPINIISGSISLVFFKELSFLKNNNKKKLLQIFKSMLYKLIILFFPLFLILFVFSSDIVIYIFGEKWEEVGVYLKIFLPMFFFRSLGSVLSNVIIVFEKQIEGFIFEIMNIFFRISSILIGVIFNNILLGLLIFSLSSSLLTVYRIIWYYKIIKEYINDSI